MAKMRDFSFIYDSFYLFRFFVEIGNESVIGASSNLYFNHKYVNTAEMTGLSLIFEIFLY